MRKMRDFLSLEDEGELAELLKMQEEQENGDMFDETYQKLKQEQLVEQKKDNDEKAQDGNDNKDSSDNVDDKSDDQDSDSDESGSGDNDNDASDMGDTGSDESSGSSSGDEGKDKADNGGDEKAEDSLKDTLGDLDDMMGEDKDSKDDKDKDDKSDSNSLEESGALKMPSNEAWHNKYLTEYKPIRKEDPILNSRYINLESFSIGEGYTKKLDVYFGNYIDRVEIKDLLAISQEAHSEAAAMSMCLGDILKYYGGHNRFSFNDFYTISREDDDDDGGERSLLSKGLSAVGDAAVGGLKYLGELGFEYGAIAMRHVGKAVVTLLDKTLKGLYAGTQALIKYIKDRPIQFKNSRALLTKAGEMAEELKTNIEGKKLKEVKPYENEKVIDTLKVNGKVLPKENTQFAFNAAKSFYENFMTNVTNCTKALTNLINMVKTNSGLKSNGVKMFATLIFSDFIPKNLSGYPVPAGLQSLVYKEILPGDLLLAAYIPEKFEASDEKEKLEKAKELYNKTSIFLAVNKATFQKNASAKLYTDIDELIEYIDEVKEMCDYCLACQKKLETYNKLRDQIKEELKDYTGSIFKSEEEITVQNSLIEYFTPNIALLDNISTKGTYVIDTYLKQHIAAAIEFINDNLKDGFIPEEGQEDASASTDTSTDTSADTSNDTSSDTSSDTSDEGSSDTESSSEESSSEEENKEESAEEPKEEEPKEEEKPEEEEKKEDEESNL